MGAVNFVDNYRNLCIEVLLATVLWFIALSLISLLCVGWTRGLEQITTRWGNLVLAIVVLVTSVLFGMMHLERWLLAVARKILLGH
ncbi:MAG: hypothetical protein K2W95_16815 [Candidatus Obscuribacterales bacterium]|nr:hypothetical protein [Candidatus Obscuribacterales bacterium]